jgi:hypothetical protein
VEDVASGLVFFDISKPSEPSLVGTYNTSGNAYGVYISGKYAYVADGASGLEVIDISNPSAPFLAGTYTTAGGALGVYVSGKYAYVAYQLSGLKVIDISNPSAPFLAGTYDTSGEAQGVYVDGKYAYVADGTSGLEVFDISNPFPSLVGTYDTSGNAVGVYVGGKYAYVADGTSGLEVMDISNPSAPSLVGTYDTSGNALGVYISGKYAYVADYTSGFAVIDINGIETPSLYAGNIATNDLTVTENADIANNLSVGNGLNIGIGGLFSNGAFSFVTSSGLGNFIQGAPTGKALLTLNQTGTQDIFTASSSGTTKFTIKNDGTASSSAGFTIDGVGSVQSTKNQTLTLGGGSTGNLIIGRTGQVVTLPGFDCSAQTNGGKLTTTSGGILTCSADTSGAGGGSSNWVLSATNGTLSPINNTLDLLMGGTSTQSAMFSVLGLAAGTNPSASVSATQGANATKGIYLSGDGSLQSVRKNTLIIGGSTTGNVVIKQGNTPGLIFDVTGKVGIGTSSPLATLDVRAQSGTLPVASVAGATSFAGLIVDNSGSGDLFTASSSGMTRFTVKQGGAVQIGPSTNGLTFDPANGGPTYTGSARPTKTITLSPEYAGAVITPFYGAGTDTNITGSMTSDTDTTVGTSIRNYYQWVATSGTQQFYTVAVRVTLPQDFSGWATSNAVIVNYITQNASTANSTVEARIYRDGSATLVASSTGASTTWTTQSWGASSLTNWNTADQTAIIYLRLGSTSSNYARVGDIKLNYLSKF